MTRIFIGTLDGLLVVDEENPQAVTSHFAGSSVEAIAFDAANPGRLYVGLHSGQEVYGRRDEATAGGLCGVWRSDNGGATWRDCSAGLAHTATMSLAVRGEPGGFGAVYAGSEPSTLAISRDGGTTWRLAGDMTALPSAPGWSFPPRPYTHHVRCIVFDPVERKRLYVCIEAGALIQSPDGGDTWWDRTPDGPFDTHTLAAHPLAPGRLYAAAGDGFVAPGAGYAESPDRGATWVRRGDGLRHHYLYGMAVDADDPDIILISAASSPETAHLPIAAESYVYRRAGNDPWELAMDGLPPAQGMTIPLFAAHPAQGGVFYAASNQGVFRTRDAGRHWEPVLSAGQTGDRGLGWSSPA